MSGRVIPVYNGGPDRVPAGCISASACISECSPAFLAWLKCFMVEVVRGKYRKQNTRRSSQRILGLAAELDKCMLIREQAGYAEEWAIRGYLLGPRIQGDVRKPWGFQRPIQEPMPRLLDPSGTS